MQALARIAHALGKGLLHKSMHILGGGVDGQLAAGQILGNTGKAGEDILGILFADNALIGQHHGVYAAAPHILADHALVKPDAAVEIVHAGIHRF